MRRSPNVDAYMASVIKALVLVRGYLQHEAAAVFGINQGRVSEIMTGKRFANVQPARNLPPGL
jgi:predicted XRE-type DNA-binding protein